MVKDVRPPVSAPTNLDASDGQEIAFLEGRVAELELKINNGELSREAQHRDLLISEVKQRIRVRYFTVFVALCAMLFMGIAMTRASHHYFWGPLVVVPPTVAIAMFVAPIVSITTITIMLLVGAYRRFKDDDMDKINVASIAVEATKSSLGGR